MADWDAHTSKDRGALISFYLEKPDEYPPNNNGGALNLADPLFTLNGGAGRFGNTNYNGGQHPTKDTIKGFKKKLMLYFREYLDGMNFNFKGTIKDEQIGDLAGDNVDLDTGFDIESQSKFVQSVGLSSADSRETGVDKDIFDRGITTSAILTPDQYIKDADRDLAEIDMESLKVFKQSFDLYYNKYKYPAEEAKKKALEDKNTYYAVLKRRHDEIYKADLFKSAKKRIVVQPKGI